METTATAAAARRAQWAITAVFGINGMLIASLVVRTPSLKLDLGLSPGQLGMTAAMFGVSAVLAMQVTGGLAGRVGSAWIVRAATVLLPVGLVGVGLVPGFVPLGVLLLGFGAVHGMLDVTMNAHAVAVERALGRHIMNGCHAAWSVGAVVGSLVGTGAAQFAISRWLHYLLLAGLLIPVALICGRALLPATADRRAAPAASAIRPARWAGWTRRVLLLGAMGAGVLTVEAAVASWSGVFLHENRGAPLGVAALGYFAFTGCQTAGRLVGDRLQARGSAIRLIRVGTLTAAGGLATVVLSPWPALSIVGFAVLGLGLATPLPVLFGVVGRLGGSAGAATTVARFSTLTYTGILLAPAVIGWVTELIGLTWTLTALVPLLAGVAAAAGTATRPPGVGSGSSRPRAHSAPPDPVRTGS